MNLKTYIVLKPTEERIIKILQNKKTLSISEMSLILKLARTSIYNSLSSLIQKKIVSKKMYSYHLSGNLGEYKVTDYDCNEQVEGLLNEILELKRGEIVYSIETDGEIRDLFKDKKKFTDWQKKVAKNGIVLKGIGSVSAVNYFRISADSELRKIIKKRSGAARFIPESLLGNCTLVVFRDSSVFMSLEKNYFYRINNLHVAELLKQIFDIIYVGSKYLPIV